MGEDPKETSGAPALARQTGAAGLDERALRLYHPSVLPIQTTRRLAVVSLWVSVKPAAWEDALVAAAQDAGFAVRAKLLT